MLCISDDASAYNIQKFVQTSDGYIKSYPFGREERIRTSDPLLPKQVR